MAQYQKTNNTAYLAICLNFTLGLRVGELVALHTKDFTEETLHICGQEIQSFICIDGKRHRKGYELVGHTKTLKSDRDLFLTSGAKNFMTMIFDANAKRGYKDGYLLLDENGERIHAFAINNVLKRLTRSFKLHKKETMVLEKPVFLIC